MGAPEAKLGTRGTAPGRLSPEAMRLLSGVSTTSSSGWMNAYTPRPGSQGHSEDSRTRTASTASSCSSCSSAIGGPLLPEEHAGLPDLEAEFAVDGSLLGRG